MAERRLEALTMRKLAGAVQAFLAWLDSDAAAADADSQARVAHRQLRALTRSRPSAEPTLVYDSLGRVIGTADPPAPADYSLRLGDGGALLVATRDGVFVFVLDERGVLHFVGRRPPATGALEGDQPS